MLQPPRFRGDMNFNPRPPCGGRRNNNHVAGRAARISIHALRAEGDALFQSNNSLTFYFNPRPPCGGRPVSVANKSSNKPISIHALRAEGDIEPRSSSCRLSVISIHALRAEGDSELTQKKYKAAYFNPRPPCGGRLGGSDAAVIVGLFQSTPSVRRATSTVGCPSISSANFNPRPPCGGRRRVCH